MPVLVSIRECIYFLQMGLYYLKLILAFGEWNMKDMKISNLIFFWKLALCVEMSIPLDRRGSQFYYNPLMCHCSRKFDSPFPFL